MGDLTDPVTPMALPASSHHPRPMPVREDCWSEEATSTLIEAWGRRHLDLNRGNLRQKDWQEVASAVNSLHGQDKKAYRTDVQCKNRIDTIKKKYKTEKARVSASNGNLTSSWIFFDRMDALIGSNPSAKKTASPSPLTSIPPLSPPMALPLPSSYKKAQSASPAMAAIAFPQKRPADRNDDEYFRRNYSAVAAAAAAASADAEEDGEDDDEIDEDEDEEEGMRKLAKAIERFGEVYERVEGEKLRQMVDLEKQRMQFAKDLEVQRLKIFMDTQVQLERMKRTKRPRSDG
ncbi:hypothetical protein SAY86_003735 [Trapa natans]|uniref:Myb/SANT-like DNA-binding domain-containing protein n=1 Tax=Trapa natans TaxID=22666 RepID=A0AAN7N4N7_TRANT|nr:hypothetical protein SAY86_003735 [Trapa natans]